MIVPLRGYVLIKQRDAETKTASGLFLTATAVEKPAEGEVIEIGDAVLDNGKEIKCPVKKGDTVVYKKWGADPIKSGLEELLLVRFEDLMAINRTDE